MTLAIVTPDLYDTVIGRWHARLSNNPSTKRSHWRTKVIYFRAVDELIESQPDAQLTWKSIVDAAQPRGSRSTFYEVAGQHARHPLIDDLIRDGRVDSMQLAVVYQRNDAVAQLVDECKVWSYWPYRERLLAAFTTTPRPQQAMEEALVRALMVWAKRHPHLAAALDYAAPVCAVEDLVIINGRLAPLRAATLLAEQLRRTV